MNYKILIFVIGILILISGCTQQTIDQTDESEYGTNKIIVNQSDLSPEEYSRRKAQDSPEYRKELEVEEKMNLDAKTFTCENLNSNSNGEINILFMAQNFNDVDFLRKSALILSGLIENKGIITREPFKSNRQKFSFWIADKPLNFTWIEKEYGKQFVNYDKYSKIILNSCNLKNSFYFLIENTKSIMTHNEKNIRIDIDSIKTFDDCSIYDFNGDGCVDIISDVEKQNRQLTPVEFQEINKCSGVCRNMDRATGILNNLAFVANHEFGHQFAQLADEYDTSGIVDSSIVGVNQSLNCFAGKLDNCLNPKVNTKWGDLIGGGCGVDDVVDCKPGDFEFEYEIGCFEGCNGINKDVFRASATSVMKEGRENREFNLLQQKIICTKIKNLTGSVSNYCNSI